MRPRTLCRWLLAASCHHRVSATRTPYPRRVQAAPIETSLDDGFLCVARIRRALHVAVSIRRDVDPITIHPNPARRHRDNRLTPKVSPTSTVTPGNSGSHLSFRRNHAFVQFDFGETHTTSSTCISSDCVRTSGC